MPINLEIIDSPEVITLQNRISELENLVSSLRQSLDEKEELELLYRAISEQATDAFFVHDDDGRFLEANAHACIKLGYTKDELLNMLVTDIEIDIEINSARKKWKSINPGERFISKGHNRKKDGSIFPVEVSFGCAQSGERKLFMGFVKDVSEHQAAEEERRLSHERLRESEAKFRNVFEASNAGKTLTLVTGEMYVNQAFSDMLGYDREELQMKTWKEITPAEDIDAIEKIMESANSYENESGIRVIKRYIKKDGSFIWADVSSKLIKDEHSNGLYHIATIIDITDRVKAEESLEKLNIELEDKVKERTLELETLNHELQAFNYSVSHDLRAPLRIMRTYAGILMQDYIKILDDQGKKYLNSLHKSAERMDKLITDLLNLSHVTRSEFRPESVDMNEIAESIYYEIATEEERKNFELIIDPLPSAFCDPSLIRQVWQNLIGNALKYSSKSDLKRIEIYAEESRNEISYYVKDHGIGFDENYASKLFTVFQRLHSTDEFPGSGIGLAIVQHIIKRHGGSVSAESKTIEGSTFCFTLKKPKVNKASKRTISEYPGYQG